MIYANLSTKELVSIAERDVRFNTEPLYTALVERLWRFHDREGTHLNTSEVRDVRAESHA
jgi:hypothetical protein